MISLPTPSRFFPPPHQSNSILLFSCFRKQTYKMNKKEEKKSNKKNKTHTHTHKTHKSTKLKTIIYKQETSKKKKKNPNQSI